MKNGVKTWIAGDLFEMINQIHKELKENDINIKKTQLHSALCKEINPNKVIEKFKKVKKRKINNMVNNPFWDF